MNKRMLKMLLPSMVTEIVKPTIRRAGSVIAGALMALGMVGDDATLVGNASVAAALFGLDLLQSHLNRRK